MSLDTSNYVIYIPQNFNIEDEKELLQKKVNYYIEEGNDFNEILEKSIKTFKLFQTTAPTLSLEDFNDNASIYHAIFELCFELFKGFWFGDTRSYRQEIYNISANKKIMSEIKS